MLNSVKHQLFLTDCISGAKKLPDASLDLVLSGPPYFDHVVYSANEENLSTKKYAEFLKDISSLWKNLEPKMKEGGIMALWLHDVYLKNGDIFELKPFHADIIKTMPDGLKLRNIVIWDRYLKKIYPELPNGSQFGTRLQYILLFSKGKTAFESKMKKLYWSPIWYFKTVPKFLQSRFLYHLVFYAGKIPFFYKILGVPFNQTKRILIKDKYEFKEYLTTCPPEVAQMIIKNFSRPGDIVCDPFLGSGTTMKAAQDLNRNCVGFEINKNAKNVILKKIEGANVEIFDFEN